MCRIARNDEIGDYVECCPSGSAPHQRIAISRLQPFPAKVACARTEKRLKSDWESTSTKEVFCHFCWRIVFTDHRTYDPATTTEAWYESHGWILIDGHRACPDCATRMAPAEAAS